MYYQPSTNPSDTGWSLIPGIPDYYISVSYARLITKTAQDMRLVAYSVAALLLAASIAVNASGWFIRDYNIKEVIRSALLTVGLLVLYQPAFGLVMTIGYNVGELIVDEREIRGMVEGFRMSADGMSPGTDAEGSEKGGAADPDKGGILPWFLKKTGGFSNFLTTTLSAFVAGFASILFLIATFIMPTVWLIFVTLLYVFGPFVIALGNIPKIGGKIIGNLFASMLELSLWQVWFHLCAYLVIASAHLVLTRTATILEGSNIEPGSAYTSVEAASMSLIFACFYFSTPYIVRFLIPLSQVGSMTGQIINKATSTATTAASVGAGAIVGAGGGAIAGAAGKTGLQAMRSGARGAISGGIRGAIGGTRGGFHMLRNIRSQNPTPQGKSGPGYGSSGSGRSGSSSGSSSGGSSNSGGTSSSGAKSSNSSSGSSSSSFSPEMFMAGFYSGSGGSGSSGSSSGGSGSSGGTSSSGAKSSNSSSGSSSSSFSPEMFMAGFYSGSGGSGSSGASSGGSGSSGGTPSGDAKSNKPANTK